MTKENTGVIYRIWNISNGMSYIGQTVNLHKRISRHLNAQSGSPYLCNAIKKYGKDKFKYEILEANVDESHLDKLEILYIRFFNSVHPYGYNLTKGGDGVRGIKHSPEIRAKIGDASRNREHSPETRTKISMALKGKKRSPEAIAKTIEGKRGYKHSPETRAKIGKGNRGKKYSPETRAKIGDVHRGKKLSPETRAKISRGNKGKRKRKKSSPLQT